MKALLLVALTGLFALPAAAADSKRLVMLAGRVSHGRGEHEFRAGCLLLQQSLAQVPGLRVEVYTNGWPVKVVDGKTVDDNSVFEGADGVFMYADGGGGHPAIVPSRLKVIDGLAARGAGVGCAHYAVEVPAGDPGFAMLRWTGGYFEMFWSVNPHWVAGFTNLPVHPVTRGVNPFKINDEWYYHMKFMPAMTGVTPILSALPPARTAGPNGPHSGNPWVRDAVAKGQSQPVMWTYDRPGGGRGFGFTGGHFHRNWENDDFRKVVLNSLVWMTGLEVPAGGIASTVTPEQLKANLDTKK